jgi:hypothetical protein
MKNFLRSAALSSAGGLAIGLSFHFFAAWQACILILVSLIAVFVFRIADRLVGLARREEGSAPTRLDSLSRQLSNLYVLIAWKGVPSSTLESCNAAVAGRTDLLDAWERLTRYRLLGNGMTLEEADSAAFAEFQKQRRWIAEHTLQRIENGCNKRSSFSDQEPGPEFPKKALCRKCGQAYAEAKQRWAEVLAAEKMGKSPSPHEYSAGHPSQPCPLPKTDSFKDKDGWYVTCECGFEKRGLGLDDALLEEEEHAITHDPSLRLSRPSGGGKTPEEQISPSKN